MSLKLRQAQKRFMRLSEEHRLSAFLARRQFGKTTVNAAIALKKIMKRKNHTVIFGSAKLNLSREIVRKEAAIFQAALAEVARVVIADSQTSAIPDRLTADDFACLFEAQRLEFRYMHGKNDYSRTKVVALREDTVGETGDLICDEIGVVKNWREIWEAIEPIASSNPDFRIILTLTPPPDDTSFAFEMLQPPLNAKFPLNPAGNVFVSELGIPVLRVDAFDAYADGVPVYDLDKGEAVEPAEHRRRSWNKDAWDRNYGVKFILGGAAACGLMPLENAQRKGQDAQCFHYPIDFEDDGGLDRALSFLTLHLGPGPVGCGWDLATTEKESSNPNGFAVDELVGLEHAIKAIFTWKTLDPDRARDVVTRVLRAVEKRAAGGRARRLCIDATNERYFATDMRKAIKGVPVELVIGSEVVEKPGYEPMTSKQFLGGQLIGVLEDNKLTLPPERYIKEDFRLVKKERGLYVCQPDGAGRHGDTFDATKLALKAAKGGGGEIITSENISAIRCGPGNSRMHFQPRSLALKT